MKPLFTTIAVIAAMLILVPGAPGAYTWNGSVSSAWSNPNNWDKTGDDTGYPNSQSAVVTIPSGSYNPSLDCSPTVGQLTITTGTLTAGSGYTLTIDASGGPTGKLIVQSGTLTINDGTVYLDDVVTHEIAGYVYLTSASSVLHFDDTATVGPYSTTFGTIQGHHNTARIEIVEGETLTNQITIDGALEIRAGSGTFDNDGLVEADYVDETNYILTLYDGTFSGGTSASGEGYKVNYADAILRFDYSESGGHITATGMSADIIVGAGTLDVNEGVTTTGNLTFTGGTIRIEAGEAFTAGS